VVCLSVTRLSFAKAAKWIDVRFGVETLGELCRHFVLDERPGSFCNDKGEEWGSFCAVQSIGTLPAFDAVFAI